MEAEVFRFEPSLILGGDGVARARAGQPGFLRDVEQQREVGDESRGGPFVEPPQAIELDAPAVALIGERGVGVAVAEDEVASLERGADHGHRVLPPRRGEEEHFRDRIDGRGAVEQDGPNAIRHRRPPRLLRHHARFPPVAQMRRNAQKLRRLAGAFDTFERYEHGRTNDD